MQDAWTVEEAKLKLSEVMRLARESGPQIVGKRKACVMVSQEEWEARTRPDASLSAWLVKHASLGIDLQLPDRSHEGERPDPFAEIC